MRTESSEISGEEGFLLTTAAKTEALSSKFLRQITDFKAAFRT